MNVERISARDSRTGVFTPGMNEFHVISYAAAADGVGTLALAGSLTLAENAALVID